MSDLPIDIIIPVYRGLAETQRCVESVLNARCARAREIVILNDASPEPELVAYLGKIAKEGKITLLTNLANLGFVATVNRGMALHDDRDVVLLNSDTEVNGTWLDRIFECAERDPKIATATPFSNNATICSYPRFCADNELPVGLDTAALDALFDSAGNSEPIDLPTGVGFCLAIRRTALRELGLFDVARFGKGYGEENDFCMRAAKLGWRNVLCPNVFVRHLGAVSFQGAKKARAEAARKALLEVHPDYDHAVDRHFRDDPARPQRLAVDLLRLRRSPLPVMLFVSHNLGGGTEKHIRDLVATITGKAEVLVLSPARASPDLELRWAGPGEGMRLFFSPTDTGYLDLLQALRSLGVARVHFHHLLGLDPRLRKLPADLGVAFDYTAHDFLAGCPRIYLVAPKSDGYCGEPDEAGCDRCLATSPKVGTRDIRTWRAEWRAFLGEAARIFAPSEDTASRYREWFPTARLLVASHPEIDGVGNSRPWPVSTSARPVKVAVFGVFDAKKGRDVLLGCVDDADRRSLALEFHFFGRLLPPLSRGSNSARLIDHGPYSDDAELALALQNLKPALAFFPAQCPETYSYTLSAALRVGIPVIVSDLGAFPERIAEIPSARIQAWNSAPSDWNDQILCFAGEHPAGKRNEAAPKKSPRFHYATDYLDGVSARPTATGPLPSDFIRKFAYDSVDHASRAVGTRARLQRIAARIRYSNAVLPIVKRIPGPLRRWVRARLFS